MKSRKRQSLDDPRSFVARLMEQPLKGSVRAPSRKDAQADSSKQAGEGDQRHHMQQTAHHIGQREDQTEDVHAYRVGKDQPRGARAKGGFHNVTLPLVRRVAAGPS